MVELTSLDKHNLQSCINYQVCSLKKRRKDVYKRFILGELLEENCKSGQKAITEKIIQLHNLKHKLGCWEGFSQQLKKVSKSDEALNGGRDKRST